MNFRKLMCFAMGCVCVAILGIFGCRLSVQEQLFVTIAGDGEVVVIDGKSGEIEDVVPVGAGPAIIIATPDQSKVYTANWGDNTVSAIDTESHEVTSIAMESRPYIIAMAPDGKRVYAGLYANRIEVIDTATDTIVDTFTTSVLPASLFVSPEGDVLYVATTATQPGLIWAVSTETGEEVLPPIEIGLAPGWITMTPDGDEVYALNFYTDDVSVVDTDPWAVTETISTGEESRGVIGNVTPDNETLYITNLGTADLIAMDTTSHEIVRRIPFDGRPNGIHFNEDASVIYVTDYGPESLSKPLDSNFLYTGVWSSTDPGYVNIVRSCDGEALHRIEVGPGPTSVVGISRFKGCKQKEQEKGAGPH